MFFAPFQRQPIQANPSTIYLPTQCPTQSPTSQKSEFLKNVFEPLWKIVKDYSLPQWPEESRKNDLPHAKQILSPSDFGFHNALLRDNGEICFIDFEYAGWDDPAKMIGDFFSQPAIPVSLKHFDTFISEALGYSKNRHVLAERARLLFPLFQIKWCCIFLNDFLPNAARRRQFSNPTSEPLQRKCLQLGKAQQFFYSRIK